MRDLCEQVSDLHDSGKQIVLVTSGAIASGKSRLSLNGKAMDVQLQQASAAVGQSLLMEQYNSFFSKRGKCIAQILLTQDDFTNKKRFENLLHTFERLFKLGAIPIVNENDAVETEELDSSKGRDERLFGDNDALSSLVACGVKAQALVLLSNVDGLLGKDRKAIPFVDAVDSGLAALDFGAVSGRGGLPAKINSVSRVTESGAFAVIANGKQEGVVKQIFQGKSVGTLFNASNKEKAQVSHARELALKARTASQQLAPSSEQQRDKALLLAAEEIETRADNILEANALDYAESEKSGASAAFLQRLKLDKKGVLALASTLRSIASRPHQKRQLAKWKLSNGLEIRKVRVPLGVLLVIYESRPEVAVEATALALKSGNSLILKGGKEAKHSNRILAGILSGSASTAGMPQDCVQLFEGPRSELTELLKQGDCIDLVFPRGGEGLINFVRANSGIPVIFAGGGVCHLYVHEDADESMAQNIAFNAKVQKPSVCNSIETLLVHEKIASGFLPKAGVHLTKAGVELRCCEKSFALLSKAGVAVTRAAENDFGKEFSDLVLAVKIVSSLEEAIAHVNLFGTKHSEAIVTESKKAAFEFLQKVDAAAVYWNASTRFTDGGQFGFGAELGISTQKLHVRGPVGVDALYTYKFEVSGRGQVRG